MKKIIGIFALSFVLMGILGQILMATGQITEKTGEKPKPTITKIITPKPSIKPKVDPWTQWDKFKVDWREYSLEFESSLSDQFDQKSCLGMQSIFDALVENNKEHASVYGHNNVRMMSFVDYLLRSANCYK